MMKQIPLHEGYPPEIMTDKYDVLALQGQALMELPQHVLGQLPVQFPQPLDLSPNSQKKHSKVYAESQE